MAAHPRKGSRNTGHKGNPKGSSPPQRKGATGKKNTVHKSGRKR